MIVVVLMSYQIATLMKMNVILMIKFMIHDCCDSDDKYDYLFADDHDSDDNE